MIVVTAKVTSTQEDIIALTSAVAAMEEASREEAGCLDYTFSVELNNTSVVRITEKWETVAALQAHFNTPHMAEFQAAMGAHPPKDMEVQAYDGTEINPF
jgi:quinol monooxygenase YgiN